MIPMRFVRLLFPFLAGSLPLLAHAQGAESLSLAALTTDVDVMKANIDILESKYCPSDCEVEPGFALDISTIGGFVFALLVGVAVGTDVTITSLKVVLQQGKRPFIVGVICQFILMPLWAFLLTVIFKDDMTNDAYNSYETSVLGVIIIGSLPGGTTSNLFTWFVGGNVPLSILMSLFSNVAALGSMPLILYLFFEVRFADNPNKPTIPYADIIIPLFIILLGVGTGMVVRAKGSVDAIFWTAKVSSLFAIVFLFLAVVIGLIKYPFVFSASWSFFIITLSIQPAGYVMGWGLATLVGCSLRNKMTIAFETGVQSFTLGLVVAQLSFNSEKEACQFSSQCMSLITGSPGSWDTDNYQFAWNADHLKGEGDGVGKVSNLGILPGQFGNAVQGGCCRYNELIFLDAFKYSAMCCVLYSIHALWMVTWFRKIYPNGRVPMRDTTFHCEYPDATRPVEITKAEQECPPVFAKSGIGTAETIPVETIRDLLSDCANGPKGSQLALCVEPLDGPCPKEHKMEATKSKPISEWTTWSWASYKADVECCGRALIHVGVEHFGSVAVFGFNAPQWNIAALGAIFVGAKACGIYPTDTVEQVKYKTVHSGSSVAVVEDNKKLLRYKETVNDIPMLKAVVVYGADPDCKSIPRADGSEVAVYSWEAFMELGKTNAQDYSTTSSELETRRGRMNAGHACCLVYTSGTTGMPKAVMLSHDNIVSVLYGVAMTQKTSMGVEFLGERSISYLPLSHIAGFLLDIILPVYVTARTKGFHTVYFARPYDLKEGTLKNRLTFVRPTLFLGVPRVWEKFEEALKEVGRKTAQLKGMRAMMPILCCIRKSSAAAWAKKHGLNSQRELQYGRSGKTTSFYGLADGMVLSNIKAALGLDQCKWCATGAAPITQETLEYFGSLGISVNELYGMSECAGATTVSIDERHIWGSCGFAAPGMEVKVFKVEGQTKTECAGAVDIFNPTEAEQGEVCFRGRHIMMGYLANPAMGPEHMAEIAAKTREAIDTDGWLHSGDKACIGQNGMLRITGRYKELIITAGGENVAPVPIEDCIKANCAAVSNVMMVGDKKKFNVCLVTLKAEGATGELPGTDNLASAAARLVPEVKTISAAKENKAFRDIIEKAIKDCNNNSTVCPSNASQVQKFEILPLDFSAEGGEFTPTLKLKRKFVEEKYAHVIDALYA